MFKYILISLLLVSCSNNNHPNVDDKIHLTERKLPKFNYHDQIEYTYYKLNFYKNCKSFVYNVLCNKRCYYDVVSKCSSTSFYVMHIEEKYLTKINE